MRHLALLLSLLLGACSAGEVDYREAPLCEAAEVCPVLMKWCGAEIADDAGAPCHELSPACAAEDTAEACATAYKMCEWSGDCSIIEQVCKPCV